MIFKSHATRPIMSLSLLIVGVVSVTNNANMIDAVMPSIVEGSMMGEPPFPFQDTTDMLPSTGNMREGDVSTFPGAGMAPADETNSLDTPPPAPILINGDMADPQQPLSGSRQHLHNGDSLPRADGSEEPCDSIAHPIGTHARDAREEDNMASPEQNSVARFEPDVHQFVKRHFAQNDIMITSPEESLVYQPHEVSTVSASAYMASDNTAADAAFDALIPVGVEKMVSSDVEVPVNINAKMETTSKMDSSEPDSPAETVESPELLEKEEEAIAAAAVPGILPEPTLPPTPSPTPTIDPAILAEAEAAAASIKKRKEECVVFLSENNVICSGDVAHDFESMSYVTQDEHEIVMGSYSKDDQKGNFQAMIIQCTKDAADGLVAAGFGSPELRNTFASRLARYSNAISCINKSTFPHCLPDAARAALSAGTEGEAGAERWQCW